MRKVEFLVNADGKEVPFAKIRKDHLRRHNTVEQIFEDIAGLQKQLEKAKKKLDQRVARYQAYIAKKHGVEPDFKNLTLSNYANNKRVVISSSAVIEFDENLQIAKAFIDQCFEKWGHNANANLKVLVDGFFRVGKKGFLDKASILGLFQYEIHDADWVKAMELIRKSIAIVDRKQYVVLQYRENLQSEWKKLNLNFSTTGSGSAGSAPPRLTNEAGQVSDRSEEVAV